MTTKKERREPEEIVVVDEKKPVDVCFCCAFKESNGSCAYTAECKLLDQDLNKNQEESKENVK